MIIGGGFIFIVYNSSGNNSFRIENIILKKEIEQKIRLSFNQVEKSLKSHVDARFSGISQKVENLSQTILKELSSKRKTMHSPYHFNKNEDEDDVA